MSEKLERRINWLFAVLIVAVLILATLAIYGALT